MAEVRSPEVVPAPAKPVEGLQGRADHLVVVLGIGGHDDNGRGALDAVQLEVQAFPRLRHPEMGFNRGPNLMRLMLPRCKQAGTCMAQRIV